MEVHLKPETELRLNELASKTGRRADDLVEEVMSGYLSEVVQVREMLDGRYDAMKSGKTDLVGGKSFFEDLRKRESEENIRRSQK